MVVENTKTLNDYIAAAGRYKVRVAAVTLLLIIVSLAVALGMPPVYRSTATILIEQQEIPEDLVRSTITSYADQRIQVISQRVMTRSNLQEIIKKYNLYPEDLKEEPMEVVIAQLRDDIKMGTVSADVVDPRSGRPTQATIAFTVSYSNQSPALAQKVANELVSLYLNENLKTRSEMTAQTAEFLHEEAEKINKNISELEKQMAIFKENNSGQLPELMQLNMNMMDRTEREIMEVERSIQSAKERKVYLEAQLLQTNPYNAAFGQGGERILAPEDRLKQLRIELTTKSSVLSKSHPDVVRLQKEIEAIESVVGAAGQADGDSESEALLAELKAARSTYSNDHPDVKRLEREIALLDKQAGSSAVTKVGSEQPDNPAYIQLQAQLESAGIELSSLEAKYKSLKEKLNDYEQRIVQSPQVERQYRELSRDYENAWIKYKELRDKQMEAQLAKVMEAERKGERFTLIEPPELPEKPIKPNRAGIVFLGILLSFAAGLGTVAISEGMDNAVRGRRSVTSLINAPLLATVPYMETADDIKARQRRIIIYASGFIVTCISVLIAIHLLYRPLDVLWFVLARKMGV